MNDPNMVELQVHLLCILEPFVSELWNHKFQDFQKKKRAVHVVYFGTWYHRLIVVHQYLLNWRKYPITHEIKVKLSPYSM